MTITEVRDALAAALNVPATIAAWRGGYLKTDNIVVTETGANVYRGDEVTAERLTEYAVDLFTAGPGESLRDAIEAEFDRRVIPWRLNTAFFEPDTNLMHREYIIEA